MRGRRVLIICTLSLKGKEKKMGEMTANTAYMYDEVEEIRNLNKVETNY